MALVNQQVTETNGDYLIHEADEAVLKNLKDMAEHLKNLKIKLLTAETVYEDAKKEYDYYASSVLPMAMYNVGMDECKLTSGGVIKVERKFRCTPNKNAEDRAIQVAWLKQHGLEALIKEKAEVQDVAALKTTGIPYVEIDDFNTTSLKAHLCDLLGVKGGQQKIKIEDIPGSFHFQEVTECVIKL